VTDLRDQRTAVYRFYDAEDRLLYVGIAVDVVTRWSWHQRHSPWWPLVERSTVQWRDDRTFAEDEEREAVRSEGAVHNVQGHGKTPRQTFRADEALWAEFGEAVARAGSDRSAVLRQLVRWYVGEPGAELPVRPELVTP
jgi:predicted GIY-YIG superfamily endonuclease